MQSVHFFLKILHFNFRGLIVTNQIKILKIGILNIFSHKTNTVRKHLYKTFISSGANSHSFFHSSLFCSFFYISILLFFHLQRGGCNPRDPGCNPRDPPLWIRHCMCKTLKIAIECKSPVI